MAVLMKELRVIYRNKTFILLKVLFSLLYCATGYGAKALYEQTGSDLNIAYYFIFVYSMSLALMMLYVYPISKDITERMNGGLENILATGYPLKRLILYKTLGLFLSLYIPAALMVIVIIAWSRLYLAGFLSLLVYLPLINGGIALNYICSTMLSVNPAVAMSKLSFYAIAVILVLTYGPVLGYRIGGYSIDMAVSITLAVLLSFAIVFAAYRKFRKIGIEELIGGVVYL